MGVQKNEVIRTKVAAGKIAGSQALQGLVKDGQMLDFMGINAALCVELCPPKTC